MHSKPPEHSFAAGIRDKVGPDPGAVHPSLPLGAGTSGDAQVLHSLGFSPGDVARMSRRGRVDVREARHLVRDIGCPPTLAAELLLWASEVASSASSGSERR